MEGDTPRVERHGPLLSSMPAADHSPLRETQAHRPQSGGSTHRGGSRHNEVCICIHLLDTQSRTHEPPPLRFSPPFPRHPCYVWNDSVYTASMHRLNAA